MYIYISLYLYIIYFIYSIVVLQILQQMKAGITLLPYKAYASVVQEFLGNRNPLSVHKLQKYIKKHEDDTFDETQVVSNHDRLSPYNGLLKIVACITWPTHHEVIPVQVALCICLDCVTHLQAEDDSVFKKQIISTLIHNMQLNMKTLVQTSNDKLDHHQLIYLYLETLKFITSLHGLIKRLDNRTGNRYCNLKHRTKGKRSPQLLLRSLGRLVT
jgi:hypothetical protein